MHVLIDISHPAHVHFYRHLVRTLTDNGHLVTVASRDKDVTNSLLAAFSIPYRSLTTASTTKVGQAQELILRDARLALLAKELSPTVILTRNPSGTHVGRLLGIDSIFDTDDGQVAGLHHSLAARFATRITCPDSLKSEAGVKHDVYPSYKALAYLHPNRFTPDPTVLQPLGLGERPYFLIRTVAMQASHDKGEKGFSASLLEDLASRLSKFGDVFISAESGLSSELSRFELAIPPAHLHDVLAHARMYVGDSQTMAFEAGLLGVPALHYSSWSGRLPALVDFEQRYGLVRSFTTREAPSFLATAARLASDHNAKDEWNEKRRLMLRERVDLTEWYAAYLFQRYL